ncbi:MAG: hypothetical protein ACREOC_16965 [Gemmatimonadales bacterium]
MIHRLEWWQLCVPLVLGASLLQPKAAARSALAGLVPGLLGAAALALVPVGTIGYLVATFGLMVAGTALTLTAAAAALRAPAPDARRSLPGALLILAGAVAVAIRATPVIGSVGVPPVLAWAAGVVIGWWALLLAGYLLRLRAGLAWLDRSALARLPPATLGSMPRVPRAAVGVLVLGALLVLFAPHAALVVAGLILASIGAELTFRRGSRRIPVLPLVTLALLPAYWLVHTVAGPVGLGTATLQQVPLSPAAVRLVALPLGLVSWAWMGLWPLHGAVRPVMLAPVGAALWLRVAEPLAAEGLAHWQPLFVALAVGGLWQAAADGRLASVFVALGFSALASLRPQSAAAAGLLLGAAFVFKLPQPAGGAPRVAFDGVRRVGFAASAAGAGLAFAAGLQAEVVLTVLAAAGLAYGLRAASPLNDL